MEQTMVAQNRKPRAIKTRNAEEIMKLVTPQPLKVKVQLLELLKINLAQHRTDLQQQLVMIEDSTPNQ